MHICILCFSLLNLPQVADGRNKQLSVIEIASPVDEFPIRTWRTFLSQRRLRSLIMRIIPKNDNVSPVVEAQENDEES